MFDEASYVLVSRDCLAGEVRADLVRQAPRTTRNRSQNGDAEAFDSSGQNDPVNSYSAVFVALEVLCKLEQFQFVPPNVRCLFPLTLSVPDRSFGLITALAWSYKGVGLGQELGGLRTIL